MINTEGFSAMADVLALGALPAFVDFVEGKVVCAQRWVVGDILERGHANQRRVG